MRASAAFRDAAGIANCVGTINTPTYVGDMVRDLRSLARRVIVRPGAGSLAAAARQTALLARLLLPLAIRYLWRRRATALLGGGVSLGLEIEQIATPLSFIRIDPDAPPAQAEIELHWQLDGREIDTAATFAEAAAAAFADTGLGRIDLDPLLVARDPAFLDTCHDSGHQMGGACMAHSAENGVVDRDGRVFGTTNLLVAGACTFPTGSFANPTLTAIALGLRQADHLAALVKAAR